MLNDGFTKFIDELKQLKTDPYFEYYFRGHSERAEEILPRIYRNEPIDFKYSLFDGHQLTYKAVIKNEDKIYKEIILRSPQDFMNEITAIEKLVKMQHYGLPTRILDITSNPLVALFFACSQPKKIGEVVLFKIPKDEVKFYDSDTVSILANIAKMRQGFTLPTEKNREDFNKSDEIRPFLHEIRNEKPQFENVIDPADINTVLAVKVKLNNNRIIKQNGAFLLFGIDKTKSIPARIKKEWIHHIIPIKASDKNPILEDLLSLGVSESALFPEMDYQAKRVIEMYTYKNYPKRHLNLNRNSKKRK